MVGVPREQTDHVAAGGGVRGSGEVVGTCVAGRECAGQGVPRTVTGNEVPERAVRSGEDGVEREGDSGAAKGTTARSGQRSRTEG